MPCKMCDNQKNILNDPYFIIELETGYVILGWFQKFKGYTVFTCKEHGPELHNLERHFKIKHLEEMTVVAEAIYNIFNPDKINYELLGNGCPHIHWHLYPREKGDTPIVSSVYQLPNSVLFDESTRPSDEERIELINKIKAEIMRLLAIQA
ncbi:MAG TPA: HIT family protein [Clostridiales bacterium]|nr:HIT family protein [Clostridiales bacterium]